MKERKKIDRTLVNYSLGEELISSISHGLGAILSLVGFIVMMVLAKDKSPLVITSLVIFNISMILLYTVSTVYHSLAKNNGKKVLRILDHCFIYILIIGTYAPLTLSLMGGVLGNLFFFINLGAGIIGIIFSAIDFKRFKVFGMICYIAMGWVIIFAIKPLMAVLDTTCLWLLFSGGIVYTVGAVLYGIGAKKKYIHSLWHFFVLGGSILHYFCILFAVVL